MRTAAIRVKVLSGTWETLGADRSAGVWFEGLSLLADEWGPSKATFTLRRSPGSMWPDLSAFTPVEVEVGGSPVWSGRVSDTPTTASRAERALNVQCEGWQFHLDDDLYEKVYVHSDLSAWKDGRSMLGMDLTSWTAVGRVTAEPGKLSFGWAKGDTISTGQFAGVVLDLGPGNTANRISVDWAKVGGQADVLFFVRGADNDGISLVITDVVGGAAMTSLAATGNSTGTFGHAVRYIACFVWYNGGGGVFGTDNLMTVTGARVFQVAAYEAGTVSVLKASDVATDALTSATVLLGAERGGVQATSFSIPSFSLSTPTTPRAAWQAVDAYHDWVKQIDVYAQPIYAPKSTAPTMEVGSWSPVEVADQSANSGEEIYNVGVLTGQTPDGATLRAQRPQAVGNAALTLSAQQASNPSFAVDNSGWSGTGTSKARDTSVFDTAPASLSILNPGGGAAGAICDTYTGSFIPSHTYAFTVRLRRTAAQTGNLTVQMYAAGPGATTVLTLETLNPANFPVGSFATYSSPSFIFGSLTFPRLLISANGTTNTILLYIDELQFFDVGATLVDRRGFRRTKALSVAGPLPSDKVAANIIADTWLTDHRSTPFKGTVGNLGPASVRDPTTGAYLSPSGLLLKTQQVVRFSNLVDPDTGGLGRDGRLVGVTYDHATDTAQGTFDNSRASFDALMARLASVQGG